MLVEKLKQVRKKSPTNAVVDYYGTKATDSDLQGILLSTDLSAAYDTVDHLILLQKLQYYGFKDKEFNLI